MMMWDTPFDDGGGRYYTIQDGYYPQKVSIEEFGGIPEHLKPGQVIEGYHAVSN